VRTPIDAYFSDGRERVRVAAVDGDRLILEDGPRRLVGPGESVNIVDPSLRIEGTLTDRDRAYLDAMRDREMTRVMLSYVERDSDVAEVQTLLPGAEVILKIESQRGLAYARRRHSSQGRLMAARGDLYVEVPRPHRIVSALRTIIEADPQAIAASRIFDSIARHPVPECADISDVAFLVTLGYRTFLLGDVTCLDRDTVLEALNLLEAVGGEFQ
jgi:pyruvate kinase